MLPIAQIGFAYLTDYLTKKNGLTFLKIRAHGFEFGEIAIGVFERDQLAIDNLSRKPNLAIGRGQNGLPQRDLVIDTPMTSGVVAVWLPV